MKIIDLSHPLSGTMPIFPGTRPPSFSRPFTLEQDGFNETQLTMLSHCGTHLDAPLHMIPGSASLDRMTIDRFAGRALLVDVSDAVSGVIDTVHLEPCADKLKNNDFLLLKTGWGRHWGKQAYFSGYPVPAPATARWLQQFRLKGIGIDTISLDREDSASFENHRLFLAKGTLIIENLNLEAEIPAAEFLFFCLPLSFPAADGSPVRAVAVLE